MDTSSLDNAVVLLVEDQAKTREMIAVALRDKGFTVLTAADGLTGLSLVRRHLPEVVVVDAMLPKLHGFQLCRAIKTNEGTKHTLVIVITGVFTKSRYRLEAIQRYLADGFLVKPVDMDELTSLIYGYLAERTRRMLERVAETAPPSAAQEAPPRAEKVQLVDPRVDRVMPTWSSPDASTPPPPKPVLPSRSSAVTPPPRVVTPPLPPEPQPAPDRPAALGTPAREPTRKLTFAQDFQRTLEELDKISAAKQDGTRK
ncbi:MAG: response regulator [Candidatus Schekmanbacteria bacterium]|nr:response regulator [Candidatus Schekmanbacteria bacterium]